VVEKYGSNTTWGGIVHIFKIVGHPDTEICYAWSSAIEGSTKRRYYAVLKIPPIDTPEKAIRASIVADFKK
jgi:acetaldehyde dehydrogenase (acetylating)